jgi:hypothetical protein
MATVRLSSGEVTVELPMCVLQTVSPLLREMFSVSSAGEFALQETCAAEELSAFAASCMLFYGGTKPMTFSDDNCDTLLAALPLAHKYEAWPVTELSFALLCRKPHWDGLCTYDAWFEPPWPPRIIGWMADRVRRENCQAHLDRLSKRTLVAILAHMRSIV